jgi:hypothetical protein
MKKMTIVILSVAALAFIIGGIACGDLSKAPPHALSRPVGDAIAYYTCPMHPSVKSDQPGRCPQCGMELQPVYVKDTATNSAPRGTTAKTNAAAVPYPLNVCIVDGMKLGSMGEPYAFTFQGQEIKLCCSNCKPDLLKNPGKYMTKIHDAETTR